MAKETEPVKRRLTTKLVNWFDVKFGFAKTPLKPIPDFTMNPIYWLGLLLAVTFGLQANRSLHASLLCAHASKPTHQTHPSSARVPLGSLVETFHLYTAYAMIMLTFLHLIRNFFGSAHKGNRDLMWLVGIVLAVVVISFGVTGYLLPWTVISKVSKRRRHRIPQLLPRRHSKPWKVRCGRLGQRRIRVDDVSSHSHRFPSFSADWAFGVEDLHV